MDATSHREARPERIDRRNKGLLRQFLRMLLFDPARTTTGDEDFMNDYVTEILRQTTLPDGKSLDELSREKPLLLVFLRHLG